MTPCGVISPNGASQAAFKVGGMHCKKCAMRIEEAINGIPGVAGRVSLKKAS